MLLGARQFFSRPSAPPTPPVPTARDYVQDGLIAMWDGIENAGWGVHDATATTWKDLIGTRDATLSGTYSWGDKTWNVQSVSGQGLARWDGTNLPSSQTWEIAIFPSDSVGYGRMVAEGQAIASPIIRPAGNNLWVFGYGMDKGAYIQEFVSLSAHTHTIVHPSGGPMVYHIDGVAKWTENTSNDSIGATYGYFANRQDLGRGVDAAYYSVRLYNRALTAAEIAANYAVDAQRFNLS